MLAQRLIVAIIIIPLLTIRTFSGGWVLAGGMAAFLGFAAWEYWKLFSSGGYQPSVLLLVAGTAGLVLSRHALQFSGSDLIIVLFLLLAMGWHVVQFEKGGQTSAADFGITMGGLLYIGWLGAYLISLRDLPDGFWWLFIVIPTISIGDAGAYFIGSRFGKHKLCPRVSPKKSWEGYIGGIIAGTLGGALLAALWHLRAPAITLQNGMLLSLAITTLSPLGDLGESMLKRNFGIKDSGHLLPGHGGVFDRVDSWLWAAPIGFYIITLFFS